MKPSFHSLTISNVRHITADAVELTFALPDNLKAAYTFEAGQYLTLKHEDIRRSYSLCSAPFENRLSVAVKAVDGGLFSSFAQNLKAGDALQVMTPQGRFTLKPAENTLMIAIGSGITPLLSQIKTLLSENNTNKITLIYGNKTTQSIMFREELEDLKDKHLNRLTLHHILSREASDFALLTGRINKAKIEALIKNETFQHAYICGAEELLPEVKEALASKNITIHSEIFTPAEGKRGTLIKKAAATNFDVALTLRYDGNAHLIPMSKDETVLDAATRHGLELPFSCKGGMCCTCRAHVSEGEAKMELNYSLEEWEQQAGFTLTCQAKPLTPQITIDFDRV